MHPNLSDDQQAKVQNVTGESQNKHQIRNTQHFRDNTSIGNSPGRA